MSALVCMSAQPGQEHAQALSQELSQLARLNYRHKKAARYGGFRAFADESAG